MTIRKPIKPWAKTRGPMPIEIYTARRIAEFDAAEAELGRYLSRKRRIRRPKSAAKQGSR